MHKYIEIYNKLTDLVVKRVDVTGKSEKQIDTAESGMNINLNHQSFATRIIESEVELEILPIYESHS